jgi:hypothetical protein
MQEQTKSADRSTVTQERVGALLEQLARGGVVLQNISTVHGPVDYVVFRPEGVVFLIETQPHQGSVTAKGGRILLNGRPLPNPLIKQPEHQLDWLRAFLRAELGGEIRVEGALVFPNADVAAGYQAAKVAVFGLEHLEPWMDTARPNDEFSKRLWPRMGQLKAKLLVSPKKKARGPLAVVGGLVLLVGTGWLTVSLHSAPKQPAAIKPVPKIVQAEPKVAAPVPQSMPAWVKEIHLDGISGAPPLSLAIINGKTLALGESASIKVEGRDVNIRCLRVVGESAVIAIEGSDGSIEIRLRDWPRRLATAKRN